jgi:phage protein D
MASNVVNLNRFRKQKRREEESRQAEVNRVRHGRTKGEKERELADRERAARLLEGKRLGAVDDPAATTAVEADVRPDVDP